MQIGIGERDNRRARRPKQAEAVEEDREIDRVRIDLGRGRREQREEQPVFRPGDDE